MEDQRIILPPRATSFRAVCSACQADQPASRGYLGAIVALYVAFVVVIATS